MVKRCFVPECTTGNALYVQQQKSSGLRNKSLFKPPKNTELFAQWVKAIPRKDKVLSESSYVCELHFEENDVQMYDETILWDGTVNLIKRIRPLLRTGAVPCIFPNLPFNSTKHKNKRKPPTERFLYIEKNKSKITPALSDTSEMQCSENINQQFSSKIISARSDTSEMQCCENINQQFSSKIIPARSDTSEMQCSENINQQFSFQYLKENLNQLEKPDSKWVFELKDDEVELVRWNRGSSKRITISNDLIVKIFFSGIEVSFDFIVNKSLFNMNETNELLKYIHYLIECKGIMITENNITRRSITCKGYVEIRQGQRGPKSNYCLDCRVGRKKMADGLRKKVFKLIKLENNIQEK